VSGFSRRSFLKGAAAAGVGPLSAAEESSGRVVVHVPEPAGAAPLGAPAETAIPFPRGRLRWPAQLALLSPRGKAVLAQMRPTSHWPDGSVRWLFVIFEPDAGPGDYALAEGAEPGAASLVREDPQSVVLDSGEVQVRLRPDGSLAEIAAAVPVASGAELVIVRRDGVAFRSSLAAAPRLIIEERGPLRATARVEGRCRAESGAELFDYVLGLAVYRGRPEVHVTVTWINTTSNAAEQVRDIRLLLPFRWQPDRLVAGCERGIYDGPFLSGWPTWILQEDQDRYWARTRNPDGRVQNLASGGANGERCPGWLAVANAERSLSVQVRDFREKYPNEIALGDGELSIGLWPERANAHLKTKPLLPANPYGDRPYRMTRYWPVMPHPYLAFVSPEDGCLDAPQGLAMTQEIVIGAWAGGAGPPTFERKLRQAAMAPVRATLEPEYVCSTAALGPLAPRDATRFPRLEQMFDENFRWFDRHIDVQKCYGKFDYGDFKYFTAGTDYLTGPGTKWGEMGEMAREGYWHNNERDPVLGLLLYHLRTGSPVAWQRCRIAARHALDVDLRHFPHWGMWTHGYGHCYVALGEGGEPDHSWLLGLLDWAAVSGDALAADWVMRCGERLAGLRIDFEQADARTAAVFLHMMCRFHLHTASEPYLAAARPAVAAFRKLQNVNGSWPAYLGNMKQPRIEGFVEHAVMALADYYAIEPAPELRQAIDRALAYLFGEGKVDPGESGLGLYALAVMREATGEPKYAATARLVLEKLRDHLNLSPDPYGRGDLWAGWGPNGSEGRPPQLLGQTRPLAPATLLAYGQPAMAALESLLGS
jgi:hypothetical protein